MRTPTSVRFVTPLALALALAAAAARADVVIPSIGVLAGRGRRRVPERRARLQPDELADQRTRRSSTTRRSRPDAHGVRSRRSPRGRSSPSTTSSGRLFGKTLDDGAFGPIRFQTSGALIVSSSVNNVQRAAATASVSGQWLPGLDATAAVKAGTLVQLASSVDLLGGLPHERRLHEPRRDDRDRDREGPEGRRHASSRARTIDPLARERLRADRQLGRASRASRARPTRISGSSSRATSRCSPSRPSSTTPPEIPSRSS